MTATRLDPLPIEPLRGPVDATVPLPGSKSITNRALVCAALAAGSTRLEGVLFSDDTEAMLDCLDRLGIACRADRDASVVEVDGCDGVVPPAATEHGPLRLDARQAGTVARFLPALLALGAGTYRLDGSPQLRERPIGPLADALRQLGASVDEPGAPGHLPLDISASGVDGLGAAVALPGNVSSQFVSGLLLAAPYLPAGIAITLTTDLVSEPYVVMTRAVMAAFGVPFVSGEELTVRPGARYRSPGTYVIEPDASAASYPFALAALTGGRVTVDGLGSGSLQGDVGFVDVLRRMGCTINQTVGRTTVIGPPPEIGLSGVEHDLRDMSDTAPTLGAVAARCRGTVRATGIGFIRAKETDRIGAVVTELRRCGIDAAEEPDGFVVHPPDSAHRPPPHAGPAVPAAPVTIATYADHRMAMSFALLGLLGPGVAIADPGCVAKTFPGYWDLLDALRAGTLPPAAGDAPTAAPTSVPPAPGADPA